MKKFFTIFATSLKNKKWTIVIYCVLGFLILWMYASVYPSTKNSSQQMAEFIKKLPPQLNEAFGLDPEAFTTFEGLISGKNYSLVWPIMVITFIFSLVGSFFASEIEEGKMEFLLSQPVERSKIFGAKLLAVIFSLILFIIFSIFLIFPLASFYQFEINNSKFLNLAIIGFLFALAILGITLFVSVIFKDKSKTYFWLSGVLVLMYVVNIVALIKENLEKIKYFSLFYYFNYSDILINNRILKESFWVLGSVFLIFTFLAFFLFNKSDLVK